MFEIVTTVAFDAWLDGLSDSMARQVITGRIRRLAFGLMGDVKPVGQGVSELRVHFGPGYRVYFVQRGKVLIVVLCGGHKRTQKRDIEEAKRLAAQL